MLACFQDGFPWFSGQFVSDEVLSLHLACLYFTIDNNVGSAPRLRSGRRGILMRKQAIAEVGEPFRPRLISRGVEKGCVVGFAFGRSRPNFLIHS